MTTEKRIRVLVVDDSAIVRHVIADTLSRDPELEVVGTAANPYIARDMILQLRPDVLTLDIEMPRMDGLTFLRVLQKHYPLPVVIISALTQSGSSAVLEALEAGAVDVLGKPTSSWSIGHLADELAQRVKGAAAARRQAPQHGSGNKPGYNLQAHRNFDPHQLILIGASTGGTEALKEVLTRLPAGLPGICIVQHIPAGFSKALAERLNGQCALEVREAAEGDTMRPGLALIAPGDQHMLINWQTGAYRVVLKQGPPLHYTRPAVDVLFNAAAACSGGSFVAVLLTGMGHDGAAGMAKLKSVGAITIAQNEQTCVVFGMPRAAIELGVVDQVLPLEAIPQAIVQASSRQMRPPAAVSLHPNNS
jgi:two-component system, chemotaxis family, protein-glutamate methylesterase/glutaminase